jgi:DNA-binding XRE family transcriptional regulator
MRNLYLPYDLSFDETSRTFCCEGVDRHGKPFGVGSGPTLEAATLALRAALFESLIADAADCNDHTLDLCRAPRGTQDLCFSVQDLLPIRIRLARAQRRLNQGEVAARMGISQQAYSRLERPGSNPTLALLARLETALQEELLQLA